MKNYCDDCIYEDLCCGHNSLEAYEHCFKYGIKRLEMPCCTKLVYGYDEFDKFMNMWYGKTDSPLSKDKSLYSNVLYSETYKRPLSIGDINMKDLFDYYWRKRIGFFIENHDFDSVLYEKYEAMLLKDDVRAWWHEYSKAHIERVFRFLTHLKKGITNKELNLYIGFYNSSLPRSYRFGLVYGVDVLNKVEVI